MSARLALGAVQFGLDYGIANKNGKVGKNEVFRILEYAYANGIDKLDTAYSYGESQSIIEQFISQKKAAFDVISKANTNDGPIKETVERSLMASKQTSLYGFLVHSYEDFISHPFLWDELCALKKKGKVRKIGFSLYSTQELDELFDRKIVFDIVQVPYSIFDRRFESYFQKLKDHAVEIYVRSVFLQGLAFLDPDELTGGLRKAMPYLQHLNSIADSSGLFVSAICLDFALINPFIDHVVVGVDSLDQLKTNVENVNLCGKVLEIKGDLNSLSIEDEEILMPYKWEKV